MYTIENFINDNASYILEDPSAKENAENFANAAWENYETNAYATGEEIEYEEELFKIIAKREFIQKISVPENNWI